MSAGRPKALKKTPEPGSKSTTLVNRLKPNQTPEAATARLVVEGLASNTVSIQEFSAYPFRDLDVTECQNHLVDLTERINAGDLGDMEALLGAQTVTLNAIFNGLAHRAHCNFGQYLDASDRYMRLALKAQSQCRATVETLAFMKNPTGAVFARQANISHGGAQQINNGSASPAGSRTGNLESGPIRLLEANGERLDAGTTGAAGASNSSLATVDAVHRPAKPRRKDASRS